MGKASKGGATATSGGWAKRLALLVLGTTVIEAGGYRSSSKSVASLLTDREATSPAAAAQTLTQQSATAKVLFFDPHQTLQDLRDYLQNVKESAQDMINSIYDKDGKLNYAALSEMRSNITVGKCVRAFGRHLQNLCWIQLFLAAFHWLCGNCGLYRWSIPKEPMLESMVQEGTHEECFSYDTIWYHSCYEITKLAFMTLSGWAAMRFLWSFACFFGAVVCISASSKAEFPAWRTAWLLFGQAFGKLLFAGLGFYTYHVRGHPARPKEARILFGNHMGPFELIALYLVAWFPSFVSGSVNLSIPFFKGLAEASDAIIVNRENADSRSATLEAITAHVNDPSAGQLMVFPEGTTSNQKCLFRFSKGAFSTGSHPVQPIAFRLKYRHFNPCFVGSVVNGHDLWDLMWRSCCQFVQHLEIVFLEPVSPTVEEVRMPEVFANNMQRLIAAHLHTKITKFTRNDYMVIEERLLREKTEMKARRHRRSRLDRNSEATNVQFNVGC